MPALTRGSPYLTAALDAAISIRRIARTTKHGLTWLPDPD